MFCFMLKITFIKGVMHKHGASADFATYVEFTDSNVMQTVAGLRYEYNGYWYSITDDTEFVLA